MGFPLIKAAIFSAVAFIIRWRLSFGAQLMCGVIRQFFALRSGLSGAIGSVDTTSSPAAKTLPELSASARSCSTISGPRLLFMHRSQAP